MTELVELAGGQFLMGTDDQMGFRSDMEGPVRQVEVAPFAISPYTVTNQEFYEFFKETGYISQAERYGSSFVFHLLLDDEVRNTARPVEGTPWWLDVEGANWRLPEGPGSNIADRMDHPVLHVSWLDAVAYADWAGLRLPTEAEWEFAARGGVEGQRFPWGDDLVLNDDWQANTFQGNFPSYDSGEDGFIGTAPVRTYQPNPYGLYQLIGNVWEWCLNPGRMPLDVFEMKQAEDFMADNDQGLADYYAMRGGSFLCHESYCRRYRIGGRNANTPESSSSNVGFRVAKSL